MVVSELLWPSVVSTGACFFLGQPLLLVLAFSQDLLWGVIQTPSGAPARCFRRRCVMAMVFGFVVLPTAQALLLGEGVAGMHDVVIVDWFAFGCCVWAMVEYAQHEGTYHWTGLLGLLLAC